MTDHAVLIAPANVLSAMKARVSDEVPELPELLAFTDGEALRALEVITTKRPRLVVLERKFAATPRGAALVNRIKADPSLAETEIRLLAPEEEGRDEAAAPEPQMPALPGALAHAAPARTPAATPELDYRGTRRVPRYRIGGTQDILVDGSKCALVDLSTHGAQLITSTILRPNQRVRVSIADDSGTIRCSATVVWASFEIPKGANPRYRAGLDFIKPDPAALDGYIRRHRQADQLNVP